MSKPVVDPSQPVDYASSGVPSNYACHKCNKTGVKLWRDYQTFLENQTLLCADDAAAEQQEDISTMQPDGKYTSDLGRPTDQIGWRIPAIPTAENDTFWGYTSVPPEGCAWWDRLPVR